MVEGLAVLVVVEVDGAVVDVVDGAAVVGVGAAVVGVVGADGGVTPGVAGDRRPPEPTGPRSRSRSAAASR